MGYKPEHKQRETLTRVRRGQLEQPYMSNPKEHVARLWRLFFGRDETSFAGGH